MENLVASRRLRKSTLKEIGVPTFNSLNDIKLERTNNIKKEYKKIDEKEYRFKISFKKKLVIKCIIGIILIIFCLIGKLFLKENSVYKSIIVEYNKDYSKLEILESIEKLSKNIDNSTKYIVPQKISNYISSKYKKNIKPIILNFEVKNLVNLKNKSIYEKEETNLKVTEQLKKLGIGGGEPIINNIKQIDDVSSVSMMQDDIRQIISKNINIKVPLKGTITSRYGAREQIFDNINGYHTGIDIACKQGTEISSATKGIVKKIQEMDKYYGNNIEIEINGVTFKYAHMSKILVKKGMQINQGEIIGLVGSTGLSTGPHLHFEIQIDTRSVDPGQLINL